jgi:hypothetical protein
MAEGRADVEVRKRNGLMDWWIMDEWKLEEWSDLTAPREGTRPTERQ